MVAESLIDRYRSSCRPGSQWRYTAESNAPARQARGGTDERKEHGLRLSQTLRILERGVITGGYWAVDPDGGADLCSLQSLLTAVRFSTEAVCVEYAVLDPHDPYK